MKKTISIILASICIIILLISIAFSIYGIVGINQRINELNNTPGSSGVDYWLIGMGDGIILFLLSVVGGVISAVSTKVAYCKTVNYISTIAVILFVVLLFISIFIFYV